MTRLFVARARSVPAGTPLPAGSYVGAADAALKVTPIANRSFRMNLRNRGQGGLTEALTHNFAILKVENA